MKKSKNLMIRINLFDYKLIKIKAEDCGISTSEFIRKCALNKSLPKSLNSDELEVYKDLKKYHHNFTAISNLLKKGDYTSMIIEIKQVQNLIKEHLKHIRNGK